MDSFFSTGWWLAMRDSRMAAADAGMPLDGLPPNVAALYR